MTRSTNSRRNASPATTSVSNKRSFEEVDANAAIDADVLPVNTTPVRQELVETESIASVQTSSNGQHAEVVVHTGTSADLTPVNSSPTRQASSPHLPVTERRSRTLEDKISLGRGLPEYVSNIPQDFPHKWASASNGRRYKSHVLVDPSYANAVYMSVIGVVSYFSQDNDDVMELSLRLDSKFHETYDDSDYWDQKLWELACASPIKMVDDSLHPIRKDVMKFVHKPRTDKVMTPKVSLTGFDGVELEPFQIQPGDLVIVDFTLQVYRLTFDSKMSTDPPVSGVRHVLCNIQVLDPGYDDNFNTGGTPSRPAMLTPKRARMPL
jgi:hypothetical protein